MSSVAPTILVVLDGLGISLPIKCNAFFQAHTPHLDAWKTQHFYTTLQAAGIFVGLEKDYHGNSQVGHFTLGAGKVIEQTSTRLNKTIQQNILHGNHTLTDLLKSFNPTGSVHLLGMISDGNIHSNIDHAKSFILALAKHGFSNIFIHAFLDGRDCPPRSALSYLAEIQTLLDQYQCGKIATVHGRFYAMDRNNNDDRTEQSFTVLTKQQMNVQSYEQAITQHYADNITDEFIPPFACAVNHTIKPGHGVIFFNFRPDRARQLTKKLLNLDLAFFLTPVTYHPSLTTTPLIPEIMAEETLLEILSTHNKTIFTIAETEKYAHVTYFFNGHRDIIWPQEERVLIPSRPEQPCDQPTMQAKLITDTILSSLQHNPKNFYLINYANADMVGHSGNLQATVQAIEFLDAQLACLYEQVVIKQGGTMYITADHGNAEQMFDEITQQPCTSHTSNPVPFYMLTFNKNHQQNAHRWNGKGLADVASLILQNINL